MQFQRAMLRAAAAILPVCAVAFSGFSVAAQTAGTPQSIEQKLSAQFTPAKATADRTDIVTAGAVLVLKKDGLLMISTTSSVPSGNTYRDGKISHGAWKMAKVPGLGGIFSKSGDSSDVQTRTFVTGEKFFVTKITVHDDGIVFELMSDPFNDVRYYATLKFPFAKGVYPTDDDALKSVSEVLDVAPADNSGAQTAAAAPGAAPAAPTAPAAPADPPPPAMAAIPPPPPPSDAPPAQPKTIALKQTKEQVVAMFGQPTKVVKLPTKEIDYYPDMKVTFVNNKVTDVQ